MSLTRDPSPFIQHGRRRRGDPRRDTISIQREQSERDRKWFGAAPRIVPETDKNFRPSEFRF